MQDAVWLSPVRVGAVQKPPTKRRSSLPLEAAIQYQLLDSDYCVTDLSKELAALSTEDLYARFARHILLRLGGLRVTHALAEMQREGRKITGDSLAVYLTDHGFPIPIHNTGINSLRMWLERAGVINSDWQVNEARVEALVGLDRAEVGQIALLNEEQRAYLEALCRINPQGECPAAGIRDLAEQILGRRIPRDSLPKRVLADLRSLGFIDYRSGGTASGKSAILWTTDKFTNDALKEFLEHTLPTLDKIVAAYFLKAPSDIYAELSSADKGKRGWALEAYAVHIMRLMGFRFVGWRKRAHDTSEVDVVMRGLFGNSPTRWQVQCKNKPDGFVDVEDVAKEVGVAVLTKATHILMIVNGRFTKDARTFAKEIMKASPLTIFLIDRTGFDRVQKNPGELASILKVDAVTLTRLDRGTTMWGW